MQDRFKFRAHVKNKKKWHLDFSNQEVFEVLEIGFVKNGIKTVTVYAFYDNGDYAIREIDFKDVDLIQCTGLKDKNNKLIYKGDIVKRIKVGGSILPEVEYVGVIVRLPYGDFGYCVDTEYKNQNKDKIFKNFIYGEQAEIIGNIYENPELLEEAQ